MKQNRVLLVGETNTNCIPLSLLLESYGYRVSILGNTEDLLNSFTSGKTGTLPADLILFGTILKEKDILHFFKMMNDLGKSIPFIILSESKKDRLINQLLNLGFYGYPVNLSEPVILIERVNKIFFNINKFRKNEKQNSISR